MVHLYDAYTLTRMQIKINLTFTGDADCSRSYIGFLLLTIIPLCF